MNKFLIIILCLFSFNSFAISDSLSEHVEKLISDYELNELQSFKKTFDHFFTNVKSWEEFSASEKIVVAAIGSNLDSQLRPEFISTLEMSLTKEPTTKNMYLAMTYLKNLPTTTKKLIKSLNPKAFNNFYSKENELSSALDLKELLYKDLNLKEILGDAYASTVVLFLFCRKDRHFPCLKILKDKNLNIVYEQGEIWNSPSLLKSRKDLTFNQRNGNTPAGVYTLDAVMPEANEQYWYGKNRRIIMNFLSANHDEDLTKKLLTPAILNNSWWKEAHIARDIGRTALRIHGCLERNDDRSTIYYPLVPSSGCIKNREGNYDGIEYDDQRVLLDLMMENLGLTPNFNNETYIKGILYVINLEGSGAVTLKDLKDIL